MPVMPNDPGKAQLVGAIKSKLLVQFGELESWLCDACYPDGKPIGSTQLSIRRRGASVYGTLKVADQGGLKLEVCEPSVERALVALEALLRGQPVPWQPDPFPLDQGGRKKK